MGLTDEIRAGSQRALARLATLIENDDPIGREGLARLYPSTGNAHVVGITGPPGSGKSTLLDGLIGDMRMRGKQVGVIAIDPTSPFSGGATLGDRVRMLERHSDEGVFIRSMASRGRSTGLAPATSGIVHLLDAAGFDVIMVETVGVGQEETSIAALVHTLVLVQVPAAGDGVQLLKAGLLECADLYVVNKADLPGSQELTKGLRSLVGFSSVKETTWIPPILPCVAQTGTGIGPVGDALTAHHQFLLTSGLMEERRREIAQAEIVSQVTATIVRRIETRTSSGTPMTDLVERVADRTLAPLEAVDQLLGSWADLKNASSIDQRPTTND